MTTSELLLTVSMPNYNHGHYLETRIDSLLSAMPPSSELIIVDDGSTDNSVAIIEKFASKDTRLKLIKNSKNKGVNESLNIILREAKGKYIAFQSADDFILPDFFTKMLEVAHRYPNVGICCSDPGLYRPEKPTEIEEMRLIKGKTQSHAFNPLETAQLLRSTITFWIAGHTSLIKRSSLLRMGGFHAGLDPHADWFLLYATALEEGLAYLPEMLAIWRIAPNSHTSTLLSDTKRGKKIHRHLLHILSEKKHRNLRFNFKKSNRLEPTVKLLFWELLLWPRHWDILLETGLIALKRKAKRWILSLNS